MKKLILLVFIVNIPFLLFSQKNSQDSSFVAYSISNAISEYENRFKESVLLHTGGEYVDYDNRVEGFPYFLEDNFIEGCVVLNGVPYKDLLLKYDIHKDLLVIEHYDGKGYMQELELVSGKVDSFSVHGYEFFRLRKGEKYSRQLDPGFYNLLYKGDVTVLSKRHKIYDETINNLNLIKKFLLKDKFYVVNSGEVYQVRNKRSVLQVFKDKKKELKKELKRHNVNFKNDFERSVIVAAEVYQSLINNL